MTRFTRVVPLRDGTRPFRALRALAIGALLGTAACLDDSPVAPSSGAVRLAIAAQVAPGPGERAVAIRVYYYRQNETQVELPVTPSRVNVPRGGTSTRQVTVQISECLADPQRALGESAVGCHFYIELRLLDDDGEFISEQTQEVDAAAPGQEVPVPPFNLPQASVGVSSSTAAFEAMRYAEGTPPAAAIAVFSTTGAVLGELSEEVIYPEEGPAGWLAVSNEEGTLILRPDRTNLIPGTHSATVRVSASRDGVLDATVSVTYTVHPPSGGGDLVMLGDGNFFDVTGLASAENQRFVSNLVAFGNTGTRSAAKQVLIDCGRSTPGAYLCSNGLGALSSALTASGYQPVVISSTQGSLTSIPANAKVVMLLLPCQGFGFQEVNALKQFAGEGGRVVLVSEYQTFYGDNWQTCAAVQNALARSLGTMLTLRGGEFSCGYTTLTGGSLRPHQITGGMTSVVMGCASEVSADTTEHPLFRDAHNEVSIAAAAKIDPEVVIPQLTDFGITFSRFDTRSTLLLPWTHQPSSTGR